MQVMFTRLRAAAAEFGRDKDGAVVIVFAFLFIALIGTVGIAVDTSRAFSAKAALQQDLDATMLYVATEKVRQGTSFDVSSAARAYIDGLDRLKHDYGTVQLAVSEVDDATVQGQATAIVPSRVMRVLGFNDIEVDAVSSATASQSPIELALVLDNTTSMAGAKLQGAKDAAKSLIDIIFQASKQPGNVRVSIVPFAEYVNVGMNNRNASWIDVPNDTVSQSKDMCSSNPSATLVPGSCSTASGSYWQDGASYNNSYDSCTFDDGSTQFQCAATDAIRWYGCVGSRNYPLDVKDEQYSTRVPGLLDHWCPQAITPLTDDDSLLKNEIDAMFASGSTYIPTGILWGWTTLSPGEPFAEARDYNAKVNGKPVRKIMVLMTDGENSVSPNYPNHWNKDIAVSNQLTSEVCTGVKDSGIEIYAVAFDVVDPTIKSILENCASSPSNYYDAVNASELVSAFEDIASSLAQLRLTK